MSLMKTTLLFLGYIIFITFGQIVAGFGFYEPFTWDQCVAAVVIANTWGIFAIGLIRCKLHELEQKVEYLDEEPPKWSLISLAVPMIPILLLYYLSIPAAWGLTLLWGKMTINYCLSSLVSGGMTSIGASLGLLVYIKCRSEPRYKVILYSSSDQIV